MFTCQIEYEGKIWNVVYINGTINEEDGIKLHWNMVDMYAKGKKVRSVKGEGFEARIKLEGITQYNCFSGTKFSTILETNEGKRNLVTLLLDRVNANLN